MHPISISGRPLDFSKLRAYVCREIFILCQHTVDWCAKCSSFDLLRKVSKYMIESKVARNTVSFLPVRYALSDVNDFSGHVGAWDQVRLESRIYTCDCEYIAILV